MAQYGLVVGVVLILAVIALAFALASRAANSVKQFRQDHHVHFLGRREP
jgi:hypothetical protein